MPTSYLLKITLKDTPYIIWRRFVVPSGITLDQFHDVVQVVMGWKNCHFHAFFVGQQQYMPARTIIDDYNVNNDLPEEKYALESLAPEKGVKIRYWYDFGDDWRHEIVVENTNYINPDKPQPIYCIEGVRACPPDDCGGVYGFVDFCEQWPIRSIRNIGSSKVGTAASSIRTISMSTPSTRDSVPNVRRKKRRRKP